MKISKTMANLEDKVSIAGGPGDKLFLGGHTEKLIRQYIPDYENDPDYQALIAMRGGHQKKTMEIEEKAERLRKLLKQVPNQNEASQGIALREMGFKIEFICDLLHHGTAWFYNHVKPYVDPHINQGYDLDGAIYEIESRLKIREV